MTARPTRQPFRGEVSRSFITGSSPSATAAGVGLLGEQRAASSGRYLTVQTNPLNDFKIDQETLLPSARHSAIKET